MRVKNLRLIDRRGIFGSTIGRLHRLLSGGLGAVVSSAEAPGGEAQGFGCRRLLDDP
jgi:hypothetical protein